METKKNLVAAYHVLAKLGLDDHTYTHLSSRPKNADFYYIYPFGLRFSETTEENLLKISLNGEVLEGNEYQYNKTGYVIHGSIYRARPDLNAIFHFHTPSTVAVSALASGLMPISQWALHFYDSVGYHEYNSLTLNEEEQGTQLTKDLAQYKVMFMRNHGAITCGSTIHEAMFYCYHLEQACKTQCLIGSSNGQIIMPSKEICQKTVKDLLEFEQDLGMRDWQAWMRYIKN